jgi:disulfide bond formation protein DsbB
MKDIVATLSVPAMAAAVSLALLLAALWFEHFQGLAPCPLCMWQRWAHVSAVLWASCAILLWNSRVPGAIALAACALSFLGGAAVAGYHVGVEQKWWTMSAVCTVSLGPGTLDDLRVAVLAAYPPRCDEIPWSIAGLSMAAWNGIASLLLSAFVARAIPPRLRPVSLPPSRS